MTPFLQLKLKVQGSLYTHIIYLLKNLNQHEIEIIEDKKIQEIKTNKQQIKELFHNKKVSLFNSIDDPVKWQKKQREDW